MSISYPSRKAFLAGCAAALLMALGAGAARAQDYKALMAAPDRSQADRDADKRRDPVPFLEFAGPKSGWKVLDMGAGAGYSTELMARAVGPTGKVYGQNAKESERFAARLKTPAMANAVATIRPYDDPLPADVHDLDLITYLFYYHDTTYMEVDRAKMNKAMFAALKPGGLLVVADHSAKPGEGVSVGKTTHRIEEIALIAEVEAAGFKKIATGEFWRNPADPRDASSHTPGLRTDAFVVKFQKPM